VTEITDLLNQAEKKTPKNEQGNAFLFDQFSFGFREVCSLDFLLSVLTLSSNRIARRLSIRWGFCADLVSFPEWLRDIPKFIVY
jgi:hypothetical protein